MASTETAGPVVVLISHLLFNICFRLVAFVSTYRFRHFDFSFCDIRTHGGGIMIGGDLLIASCKSRYVRNLVR